jgi:hypothetical protein
MYMIRISLTRICYRANKAASTAILHMSSFPLSSDFISPSRGFIPSTTGCQFPVSLATWIGVLGKCFGQCSCMLLRVDGFLMALSVGPDDCCIDMDVAHGDNGWDDICGGTQKSYMA